MTPFCIEVFADTIAPASSMRWLFCPAVVGAILLGTVPPTVNFKLVLVTVAVALITTILVTGSYDTIVVPAGTPALTALAIVAPFISAGLYDTLVMLADPDVIVPIMELLKLPSNI